MAASRRRSPPFQRLDGFVQQIQGDGIVAYFGYPIAHEQEADRAIRAALALPRWLDQPGHRPGSVAAASARGDCIGLGRRLPRSRARQERGRRDAESRATPANRSAAWGDHRQRPDPGSGWRWIRVEDRGLHELKGISVPVHAWRVAGPSQAASRFEAATQGGLTPMVGREQEVNLLLERWELARAGEGQVVLLEGEPGIGKSPDAARLPRAAG